MSEISRYVQRNNVVRDSIGTQKDKSIDHGDGWNLIPSDYPTDIGVAGHRWGEPSGPHGLPGGVAQPLARRADVGGGARLRDLPALVGQEVQMKAAMGMWCLLKHAFVFVP